MQNDFCKRFPWLCREEQKGPTSSLGLIIPKKDNQFPEQPGPGIPKKPEQPYVPPSVPRVVPHPKVVKHSSVFSHQNIQQHLRKIPKKVINAVGQKIKNSFKVATLSKGMPKQITQLSRFIKGEKLPPGFEVILEGDRFKVIVNPDSGILRVAFQGAQGSPEENANVTEIFTSVRPKLKGEQVQQEEEFLSELFKNGTKNVELDGHIYNDIKFIGHSLGGFKARQYGAEWGIDSEILNGHILPWNVFKPTDAQVNMHTIITDPGDFKGWMQPTENITHTYYQPPTQEEMTFAHTLAGEPVPPEGVLGSVGRGLEPHILTAWEDLDRDTQSSITEALKLNYPEFFANTTVASLSIAGSIYQAATDPNYNPATDPGLGGATEFGNLGINLDTDYGWSDASPPSSGLDWLVWKSLSPLAKAIASPSNPDQALANAEGLEAAGGSTLSSELYTFDYKGNEYYYQKDSQGKPIWFSEGEPLSVDIKNAYFESTIVNEVIPSN